MPSPIDDALLNATAALPPASPGTASSGSAPQMALPDTIGLAIQNAGAVLNGTGAPGTSPPSVAPAHTAKIAEGLRQALKGPANSASSAPPSSSGWQDWAADIGTGLQNGVGYLLAWPQQLASLGAQVASHIEPPWLAALSPAHYLARALPSPNDINSTLYRMGNATPYIPKTEGQQVAQNVASSALPSLLGGWEGLVPRLVAGVGSAAYGTVESHANPDSFWGPLAASLAGGLVGGGLAHGVTKLPAAASAVRSALPTAANAEKAAAAQLATAAGMSGADLADAAGRGAADWQQSFPGSTPTLANVTGNTGLRNLEFGDQTAAKRAGDVTYQTNRNATNAALRTAVAAATPQNTLETGGALAAARDKALAALPSGVSQQAAGADLRTALQRVLDQRMAVRAAGGELYDVLDRLSMSPQQAAFEHLSTGRPLQPTPQIDLKPVMDYTAGQMAQNAGEVGRAYKRALGQFRSGGGITLDTPSFAASVLKGLGDLAGTYERGTAAQRAVLDVKGRAEDLIAGQVPEVQEARDLWAQNSRPLDVFKAKPFAQALKRDPYGREYAMPNDQVAASFLLGNGSADALDRLHDVFPNPEAETRALQDFLATEVRNKAVAPDGTINLKAMQQVLQPYSRALIRFPSLLAKFKTVQGAQDALNQHLAYQELYRQFGEGTGTLQTDEEGNSFYSPKAFRTAVEKAGPLLDQAYGPESAAVIRKVDDALNTIAQTEYARIPGQSGTPQAMPFFQHVKSHLGALAGTVGGAALEHLFEGGGIFGAYVGARAGEAVHDTVAKARENFQSRIEAIRRQALTDPVYAKDLLTKFPSAGTSSAASQSAWNYIARRTPWLAPSIPALQRPPSNGIDRLGSVLQQSLPRRQPLL